MWLLLQIVGVIFPVMIMALVPIRQYIMPLLFSRHSLHELDAAEYEEAPLVSQDEAPGTGEAAELELAERVCVCNCLCNCQQCVCAGVMVCKANSCCFAELAQHLRPFLTADLYSLSPLSYKVAQDHVHHQNFFS